MKERTTLFFYDLWDSVRSQPARIGLSLFAVSIGIFALTLLMAVMSGLRGKAQAMVEEMGASTFALVSRDSADGSSSALTDRELSILRQNMPDCEISVLEQSLVTLDDSITQAMAVGTDPFLDDIREWKLADGRFLDEGDMRENRRVAVITDALRQSKNWHVGTQIAMLDSSFTIVGVLHLSSTLQSMEEGENAPTWANYSIFIPSIFAADWQTDTLRGRMSYDSFFVKVPPKSSIQAMAETALSLLASPENHGNPRVDCITPEKLVEGVRRMQRAIGWSAGSVVVLCLILGGTTLMSLMLANVRDRISEIGLRRALGATRKDVAQLFIAESCCVTGLSAVVGALAAGIFLTLGLGTGSIPLRIESSTFFIPVLASLALGCIFSYWPARVAARISPAEALRNE